MNLTVTSTLVNTLEQLKKALNEAFILNAANFFLSTSWIETWFRQLSSAPLLIKVTDNNQTLVGVALFAGNPVKKSQFFSGPKLHLNATGNVTFDQIWIEYNDCYFVAEYEREVKKAIVNFLFDTSLADEVIVGTSAREQLIDWDNNNLLKHKLFETQGYLVNLDSIRRVNRQYKDVLSRNTRYQINRSIKGYEQKFGAFTLQIAETADQALSFFEESAVWHRHRWGNSPQGSGFDNSQFVNFHRSLIQRSFAQEQIKYIKVSAGEHVLGFLYCFAFQSKIYFYLSAINYDIADKKLKPGMVMHFLAIQHFEAQGFNYYDFLGGEARYKKSLSTESYDLAMVSFRKPTYRFKLEILLRQVKNSCTNRYRNAAIGRSAKTV